MNTSAWSPLRQPLFRALWIASVASYLGTAMHDLAAGWLMASLTTSTVLVALMQTASSLPIFLVALPAGALADLVDRRRLLLLTQGWMLLAAVALSGLTLAHLTTDWSLLVLTFLLGLGGAMNAPAWQATTPELVSRSELPAAVALGGVGFNLARTFGPAVGGLIVAAVGPGAAFLVNAASFLGVMFVLYRWNRQSADSTLPGERLTEAMRAGRRYVRHSPALHAVLVRTAVFVLGASAMWALLPVIGRHELQLSALGYGGMTGCFGLGAVASATLLPRVRNVLSIDYLVAGATVLFAVFLVILAATRSLFAVYPAMAVGGVAWMSQMSTLNVAAQTSVPAWVRARALAIYLLVFQGGLAVGSVLWGAIAARVGVQWALQFAAIILMLGLASSRYYRLAEEDIDFEPSQHWPDPLVENEPHPAHGPVLVTVEYQVEPEDQPHFARVMQEVGRMRRRDGAFRWGLFSDVVDPKRCVETFVVESWAEHLRQHQRVTVADKEIEDRAWEFHRGAAPPLVSHLISTYATAPEDAAEDAAFAKTNAPAHAGPDET
jgi:MFS family permease